MLAHLLCSGPESRVTLSITDRAALPNLPRLYGNQARPSVRSQRLNERQSRSGEANVLGLTLGPPRLFVESVGSFVGRAGVKDRPCTGSI